MSVKYEASTLTGTENEKSTVGYDRLTMDSSKLQLVYTLRKSPFHIGTLCLSLLCIVLLAVVIGQSVNHQNVVQANKNELKALRDEKESLQDNLKATRIKKREVETELTDTQQRVDYLTTWKEQKEISNRLLKEQTEKLRSSQSELQASNTALTKTKEQLTASRDQLQTTNNALTKAKDLLQARCHAAMTHRNELQTSLDSVTKERDILQNRFNTATRAKEQVQADYNNLIVKVEHLQDRYNTSTSEKDELESKHQNLTITKEALQASINLLKETTDELRASYDSLVQEKHELENTCRNATAEKDELKVKNENLTAEIELLQVKVDRLDTTARAKTCPSGWRKFEASCYFTSVSKKTWALSRTYCQDKGADLAIVKTQPEMVFINSLYSSDKEVWIGLTDGGIEGHWYWVDGTPLTTTFWGTGQPNSYNGKNQDCVEFWHRATGNGEWNDENCDTEQNFICEL